MWRQWADGGKVDVESDEQLEEVTRLEVQPGVDSWSVRGMVDPRLPSVER